MTDLASDATALARWLLRTAEAGTPLTATGVLARATVRDAVEAFPELFDVEPFGPPHREADVPPLAVLREGLLRMRLLRRRARTLTATVRGRTLRDDPSALFDALVGDARDAAGDAFCAFATRTVAVALQRDGPTTFANLETELDRRLRAAGWRSLDGGPPPREDVVDVLQEARARLGAYGLLEESGRSSREWRLASTVAGRAVDWAATATDAAQAPAAAPPPPRTADALIDLEAEQDPPAALPPLRTDDAVLVLDAVLQNVKGVRATVAIRGDDTFVGLHEVLQEAFGWLDDHLYAFWLDGRWFSSAAVEITTPETPDEGGRSADDVRLGDAGLRKDRPIAYVFDFGDEWRVRLRLRDRTTADEGPYPRVLERVGAAPPQY